MEVIVLGSSAAIPVKGRNLASIALKYRSEIILFDSGEDVQRRFVDAGLKFNKHLIVLISHFHGDHVIGLPGLLFRFGLSDRTAPVTLIGPRNLFLYLYFHRMIVGLNPNYPVKIIEIDSESNELLCFEGFESETPREVIKISENTVYESKRFQIKYTKVIHSILTFAYAFIEKPRYGKFNPERAKELGIPASRVWKNLQRGEVIEFEGKKIDPVKEGIVGSPRIGRKITYSADLMPSKSLIELGKNSDLLIHEATYANELKDVALDKKHSTCVDAANQALKMNAKQLLLTHISSRYQDNATILLEQAKEIFPNTVLAEDLLKIELK